MVDPRGAMTIQGSRVAVAAADWWLPVTGLQSPIDKVNSSTGCNWFIRLRLCSLPLTRFIRLRLCSIPLVRFKNVILLRCGLEWCFFFLVFRNDANLFQVVGDVDSEAKEEDEDDAEYN
nr:hypothetical protein [Tanacetum cinerariifolium]